MLLNYLALLRQDPLAWLWLMFMGVSGVVLAITVHEAAHAWAASRLGDRTARDLGRVSLDPRRHVEPLGLLLFVIASFGWGRPTPVDPAQFSGDRRAGMGLVSAAGPASNLITAALLALPIRAGLAEWGSPFRVVGLPQSPSELAGDFLSYAILFNVILSLFNLIPLAPLDGFKAAAALLPKRLANEFEKLERFGPFPLLFLLIISIVLPFSIIGVWLVPLSNAVSRALVGHPLY